MELPFLPLFLHVSCSLLNHDCLLKEHRVIPPSRTIWHLFLLLHSKFISQYPSPLPAGPKLRCWGHQTSPPTLQVLRVSLIPKNFGVFCPDTAPSVPGTAGVSSEERQGAQHQLWGGFGVPGSRRRTQEDPSPKGIGCSAGRQSWSCHSQAKTLGHLHWRQRERQNQDFIFTGQSRKNPPLLAELGTTLWDGLGREGMVYVG